MSILLAIILGGSFGFVLQRIGASNPDILINMLRLKNLHLMRVILLGIGASSLAVFAMAAIDPSWAHFSVKTAYIGVIVGGLIFGLGFALSGFCPGTSIAALGEGRKDALMFLLGGLVGAQLFTLSYGWLKTNTGLFTPLVEAGKGKVTLASTASSQYPALVDAAPFLIASLVALIMISIAYLAGRIRTQ